MLYVIEVREIADVQGAQSDEHLMATATVARRLASAGLCACDRAVAGGEGVPAPARLTATTPAIACTAGTREPHAEVAGRGLARRHRRQRANARQRHRAAAQTQ
jgi:hypothetical protein